MRRRYKIWILTVLLLNFLLVGCSTQKLPDIKEGDLIFQRSNSPQSEAIILATHSEYSHVGIILKKDGELMVFEAIGPVKYTPIQEWISRGRGKHFAVRRLKDSTLLSGKLELIESEADSFAGKTYDWAFDWSDEKMYCSEAVWKVLARGAGLQICQTAPLKSFDLSSPKVQKVLHTRYGDHIPLDEPMVSPEQLFSSAICYTVTAR